jgi:hypothetical protein
VSTTADHAGASRFHRGRHCEKSRDGGDAVAGRAVATRLVKEGKITIVEQRRGTRDVLVLRKGGPISTAKSPVLIELVRLLGDTLHDIDGIDDVDVYEEIVFAVGHQHSTPDFHERSAPDLDDAEAHVRDRLGKGWFAERSVPTPQAWFAASGQIGDIVLRQVTNHLPIGEKPAGALWTSSFLPDGRSAWAVGEAGAYPDSARTLYALHFDQQAVRTFVIATPEHYRELVMRYPRPMPDGRALVDWLTAAGDLDAVRLTVAGLVFAQCVRVPTPYGVAQLRGWDAESTAWLNRPSSLRIAKPTHLQ